MTGETHEMNFEPPGRVTFRESDRDPRCDRRLVNGKPQPFRGAVLGNRTATGTIRLDVPPGIARTPGLTPCETHPPASFAHAACWSSRWRLSAPRAPTPRSRPRALPP